jgi:hypothetical protein
MNIVKQLALNLAILRPRVRRLARRLPFRGFFSALLRETSMAFLVTRKG